MSVLTFPRIHFAGSCLLHQPTGNRNTEGTVDLTTNHVYRNGVRVAIDADVQEFYEYFNTLGQRYGTDGRLDPNGEFSSAAGRDYMGNSRVLWNAEVTACQTAPSFAFDCSLPSMLACEMSSAKGRPLDCTVEQSLDPLIGTKVDLWGHFNPYLGTTFNQPKVVELDSTSRWTRQIYGGQFSLGRSATSIADPYLLNGVVKGNQVARLHKVQHYVDLEPHWNADEIGRADLFQFVIEIDDLIAFDNPIDSPCLAAIHRAIKEDASARGLVVQFVLFNASSPRTVNTPTFCSMIGTVGVWRGDQEMRTFPAGRVLVPRPSAATGLGVILLLQSPWGLAVNCAIGLPFCGRSCAAVHGPVHDPGRPAISEDLFVLEAGDRRPLARIPFRLLTSKDFLSSGGIVDVPFIRDAPKLDSNDLQIARVGRTGNFEPVYVERTTVVEAEAAMLYLDVPDRSRGRRFDQTVSVRSYVRGVPASIPEITLRVVPNPAVYAFGIKAISEPGPELNFSVDGEYARQLTFNTDANGHAMLSLCGLRSGSARVVFVASQRDHQLLEPMEGLNAFARYDDGDRFGLWAQLGMVHVRVLPDDWDVYEQALAADSTDFSFLYQHVLQFYELLYPFMNKEIFSLADGARCRAHALLNWQMCDPEQRDMSYYMPPTRELSYPKALLFKKFLEDSSQIGFVPPCSERRSRE